VNRQLAVITGVAGIVANILLILFFALAQPWHGVATRFDWLGPANDVVIVVQLATFIPVALALKRPATALGVAAMAAGVVLQLLLIVGLLSFEVQGPLITLCFLLLFVWTFLASRSFDRFGTLIGLAFPIGLALVALGFAVPDGVLRYVVFAVGGLLGGVAWLAFPVWPLLLARHL